MPPSINSSLADILLDGENLLGALQINPELLSNTADERAPLELSLAEIKSLTVRAQILKGDRQKTIQDRRAAILRVADQTRAVRDVIRAKVGSRSEKLVEFGVLPLRKRKSRKTPEETPEPGPDPEPQPTP